MSKHDQVTLCIHFYALEFISEEGCHILSPKWKGGMRVFLGHTERPVIHLPMEQRILELFCANSIKSEKVTKKKEC